MVLEVTIRLMMDHDHATLAQVGLLHMLGYPNIRVHWSLLTTLME